MTTPLPSTAGASRNDAGAQVAPPWERPNPSARLKDKELALYAVVEAWEHSVLHGRSAQVSDWATWNDVPPPQPSQTRENARGGGWLRRVGSDGALADAAKSLRQALGRKNSREQLPSRVMPSQETYVPPPRATDGPYAHVVHSLPEDRRTKVGREAHKFIQKDWNLWNARDALKLGYIGDLSDSRGVLGRGGLASLKQDARFGETPITKQMTWLSPQPQPRSRQPQSQSPQRPRQQPQSRQQQPQPQPQPSARQERRHQQQLSVRDGQQRSATRGSTLWEQATRAERWLALDQERERSSRSSRAGADAAGETSRERMTRAAALQRFNGGTRTRSQAPGASSGEERRHRSRTVLPGDNQQRSGSRGRTR